MNDFIVNENNNLGMESYVKIPIILNMLSFYAGRFYTHSYYKDLLVDKWQQVAINKGKKYVDLLDIKHWFDEKIKSNKDLLKPKGFEQRVLDTLNSVSEERLKNIILTDYSLTDEKIKYNLNNGVNVYRFYDLENRYVYYVNNSSMDGEFSGAVINALFGQGENKPDNEILYSAFDSQDFLAFACEICFSKDEKADKIINNIDLSDKKANKIIRVGYSFGGHKALCSHFFNAIQQGKNFDVNKNICVLINALGFNHKTIDFLKKQLGDRFDKTASRVLNIIGSSDVVAPRTLKPFGKEIFFDSESKKGIWGHDITSLDLNKKINENELGFTHLVWKNFQTGLLNLDSAPDLLPDFLRIMELMDGIKFDITGKKIEVSKLRAVYVLFRLSLVYICSVFKAIEETIRKKIFKNKEDVSKKENKCSDKNKTEEENLSQEITQIETEFDKNNFIEQDEVINLKNKNLDLDYAYKKNIDDDIIKEPKCLAENSNRLREPKDYF